MEIITRGSRRAFILKQVEKAIRSLCSKGILNQYNHGRVCVQDGVSEAKFKRYLDETPLPWEAEEAAAAAEDPATDGDEVGTEEDVAEAIAAQNDGPDHVPQTSDEDDELLSGRPVGLPPLRPLVEPDSDDPRLSPPPEEQTEEGGYSMSPEATRALIELLQPTSEHPKTGVDTPQAGTPAAPHATPTGGTAATLQPLMPYVEAVLSIDPTMRIRTQSARQAVIVAGEGCEIDMEWRRTGEVRSFVRFPSEALNKVLRHIGLSWADMRVAVDQQGRPGLQRLMRPAPSPADFAVELMRDIQSLDDAMRT